MIYCFIDTNIYLNFYRYSAVDLEELRKLAAAIENQKMKLCLTSQVEQEFRRNREEVIAEALKRFEGETTKLPGFPQLLRNYDECRQLEMLVGKLKVAESHSLHADQVIADLFAKAVRLDVSETLIQKAKDRVDLGNPPGKGRSYGDAINWEAILASDQFRTQDPFILISRDGDFFSDLFPNKLSEFLQAEWTKLGRKPIQTYSTLKAFVDAQFPNIKLSADLEVQLAVDHFCESYNFAMTHEAVAALARFPTFSDEHAAALIDAALTNDQIWKIGQDEDVREFVWKVCQAHPHLFDEAAQANLFLFFGRTDEDG
jgi:hypothetical protein